MSRRSKKNLSLAHLLGGTQSDIQCGVSLGLQVTPEVLLEKVAVELRAGYQRVKLKINRAKIWKLCAPSAMFTPGILLSVDANSAYTLAELEHLEAFRRILTS